MKILYCDCFSGISGDMLLGALLDAGVSSNALQTELAKLGLTKEYEFIVTKAIKKGISATDVDIKLIPHTHEQEHHDSHPDLGHHQEHPHHHKVAQSSAHQHEHGDAHHHPDTHAYGEIDKQSHHHHAAPQDKGHLHNRNLVDIAKLIDESTLSEEIKVQAKFVFQRLAQAEAKVHGTTIDKVHFHEVGAVDAILDICGTIIALNLLGIEKIFASALPTGSGFVECAHGLIPLPAPATAELTKNIPTYDSGIKGELVTPTGAALITSLANIFGTRPAMQVTSIGYGAGKKDFGLPNVLRVFIGEMAVEHVSSSNKDLVYILETTIDDCTPEILGYLWEKVFAAGALDMFYIPVYMKKGRPATLLTVITTEEKKDVVIETIFSETSTIGLRVTSSPRICLDRKITSIETKLGNVRFKTSHKNAKPEFDDLKEIALKTGLPLKEVYYQAIAAYQNQK